MFAAFAVLGGPCMNVDGSDHFPFLTTTSTSTMSAYGTNKAGDTEFRKKWDKQEYAEKAKKRDLEEKERMQENEERLRQGM
jgi:hypothetical protein